MKKILYIDYWTKGSHNFLRLDKELRKHCVTLFLHLSSWREEGNSRERHVDGLPFRDISYYDTNYVFKVLERERPCAVILLNLNTITDRSIVLSCKQLGIKVIYLSHGSLSVYEKIDDLITSGRVYYFNNVIARARRTIFRVFPDYWYSKRRCGGSLFSVLRSVMMHLWNYGRPVRHFMFPQYNNELDADVCLVFSRNDFDVFTEYRGYPKEKIVITGNPEYDEFFVDYERDKNNTKKNTKVTYVDEGSIDDILTIDEHIDALRDIQETAVKCGLQFEIKLHPRTYDRADTYRKALPRSVVITQIKFHSLFRDSRIVISQGSTVILYAMCMGIPVLVPRFGSFLKFPEYYRKETVMTCNNLHELELCMKQPKINKQPYSDFLSRFITYQDSMSLNRILESIKSHVGITS